MATQTGSIDLRGANSAKLYVDDEAGEIRSEVSETYATKTEVQRTDTGSGTVVSSDDAANLPPLSFTIHGKSVQDGTPTPSAPVEIRSVEPTNVLPTPYKDGTKTVSGVTFTPNEDGTITASGTATGNGYYVLFGGFANVEPLPSWLVKGETYTMYNGRADGANDHGTMMVYFYNGSSTVGTYVQRTNATFTVPSTATHVGIFLRVLSGNALNYTFSPRINRGTLALPYSPYGALGVLIEDADNVTTTYPIPLQGHAARSVPDGTEDVLEVDGEGNVTLTKRIGIQTFDGSGDEVWAIENGGTRINVDVPDIKRPSTNSEVFAGYICDRFASITPNSTWTGTLVGVSGNITSSKLEFSDGTKAMTVDGWKTWLQSNPVTVLYPLATPQTISLGKIDLPSLPSPSFSLHVDAAVTPTLDAEWWTQGGEEVGSVYQRTSALEQDVDGITLELSEKVDSSEEWVSWLHAGTDATTHEPYLAMGKNSAYPSVVYGSDAARFYDGEGDAAANFVASFGTDGVVVGKDGSANTTISDSDIVFHDADGNEAGKISMSSEGAVPASAAYTITTSGTATASDSITGITPLPDFTLGNLFVRVYVDGTGISTYVAESLSERQATISSSTIDVTIQPTQSGDTWGIDVTATNKGGATAQTVVFALDWYYTGSAPQYKFGTGENAGAYSFLAGVGLKTAKPAQVALGSYNAESQTDLLMLGDGTSDANRSNALRVDANGVLETKGFSQLYGSVTLAQSAVWGWLQALGAPFLRFAEVTTATQSIASGGIGYFDVEAPTYTGYTLRGAIQTWASGSGGNVIIGGSYRSSTDNHMHFVVRANYSASVAVKALLLYTRDMITS